MTLTACTLRATMELAEKIGAIHDAHLYERNYISVDGKALDGTKFTITVRIEEEEKDGN